MQLFADSPRGTRCYADYSNINSVSMLNEVYGGLSSIEEKDRQMPPLYEDSSSKEVRRDLVDLDSTQDPFKGGDKNEDNKIVIKNLIVFTNDKSDDNKTLHNIRKYISAHKKDNIKLYVFDVRKCSSELDDDENLSIFDDDEEITDFSEIYNTNTVVISRLGVQGEDEAEAVVQRLQDRGFLVLNPVRYAALACNKYDSVLLFEKGEIPQPRFCLMTKSILYDKERFEEQIQRVYPKYSSEDPDKNKDFDFVVKILDGHGGTGVFLIDGKRLIAVLQAIFAIDPERRLLLQKKEEADGGDIRVHVLTLRDRQVILAAMKRVKIGGDFRSNVSLGASAEKVTLTDEQKEIALKTAALSKLPWCAVDIMPLVKGSDPEVGDNVVLEINASPGTQGISEVIDENFIETLMSELQHPERFVLQEKQAGYTESVDICFDSETSKTYLGRLDTGNSTSASTLEVGEFSVKDEKVSFKIDGKKLTFDIIGHITAHTAAGDDKRPVIRIKELKIGYRHVNNVPLALVKSRASKNTNILINRDTLSRLGYVVHPFLQHMLSPEMEKVKIL